MKDDDKVRLRPVEERDLDAPGLIDTDPSVGEPFEWRGFRDRRARRRRWEEDGYLGSEYSLLIVVLPDGTAAGIVVWKSIAASGPPGCLQIGILLFPEHRGKGLGTAAQRLLADHLFSTTLANRLEATTEVDNVAEQQALEHAGFVREGVSHQFWRGSCRRFGDARSVGYGCDAPVRPDDFGRVVGSNPACLPTRRARSSRVPVAERASTRRRSTPGAEWPRKRGLARRADD